MADAVQTVQNRSNPVEEMQAGGHVLQAAGGQQGAPTEGVHPLADPVPETVGRLPDGQVTHEIGFRKGLQLFQFVFEPPGQVVIDAGRRRKNANHDRVIVALALGLAEDAGVALMQHLQNAIVVDGRPAGGHFGSAGRAGGDFFSDDLPAFATDLHREVSPRTAFPGRWLKGERSLSLII